MAGACESEVATLAAVAEKMQATIRQEESASMSSKATANGESYILSDLTADERRSLDELKHAIASSAKAGEFSSSANPTQTQQADAGESLEVSLWGVQLLDGSESADVVLLKFLRAREFKVGEALKMLENTVAWRRRFGCDDGLVDEQFDDVMNSVGFYFGSDRNGLPVCYNVIDDRVYQELVNDKDGVNKVVRWRAQLVEKGIRFLDFKPQGVSSMLQVVDLKGASMRKEGRAALSDTTQLLLDNYPELVSKLIFVNVPWYYSALYMMVSPFLTQRTKSKFSVATKGKTSELLFRYIAPDNVPLQYGGLGKQNEKLFSGVKSQVSESSVKPASMLIIEIQVNEGDEVTWEFSVPGWEVNYGAEFKPSAEGGYTIVVDRTRRLESQQSQSICNTFKNCAAGSLLLTIDNSESKKRKLVVYRYFVKG